MMYQWYKKDLNNDNSNSNKNNNNIMISDKLFVSPLSINSGINLSICPITRKMIIKIIKLKGGYKWYSERG